MDNKKKGIGIFIAAILVISVFAVVVPTAAAQELLPASDGGSTSVLSPAPITDDNLIPNDTQGRESTVGVYYAIDRSNLLTIDKDTYAVSIVGSLGITNNFGGLAFDTSTGTLYAISGRDDESLYMIDTETGAATFIGSYDIVDLFGLAYSPATDRLLGSQFISNGNLYSLDRTTGAATLIGTMGGPQIGSLAYHTGRQQLFGLEAGTGKLWTINEGTGLATLVGGDTWINNAGLAYNSEDDILLAADCSGNIYEIDPDTGDKTLVGTSGAYITGLTFAIGYIPEEPVPTLTPIGLIALVGLLSVIAAMSIKIRKKRG